jgi:hypothetical protein
VSKGREKINKYMQRLKNKLKLPSSNAIISMAIKKKKKISSGKERGLAAP